MFELLKKLKNSNYYYYADFDEEELSDSVDESSVKETDRRPVKAKKKTEVRSTKGKETKVTPITPSVTKLTPIKPTKAPAKLPSGTAVREESVEEELNNRVDALKTQVELLKKSKTKESELLKAQFIELRREKEAIELQREIDRKQIQYYQNMEAANELLQKQLTVESEKVSQLHGKLQGNTDESKRIAELEVELERTKTQLLKHIKNDTPDGNVKVTDESLEIARLEEELEVATTKLDYYVDYNEQLEVQVAQQVEEAKKHAEQLAKAQKSNVTLQPQAEQVTPNLNNKVVEKEKVVKNEDQSVVKLGSIERFDREAVSEEPETVTEKSVMPQPKTDFSDNLKALYRDLAETKKEAHLLFDEVMTVVNHKAE
ncbi:hypothetical protein [uncultured Vagococcus sp.]|uniref:hypothetical protein n=1 Tax=uncultured Vagococcus sp. TaxID=189676 RepID=UPI0028D2BD95|nr:hypothetical protein [uncultured Vagococcus sp.]